MFGVIGGSRGAIAISNPVPASASNSPAAPIAAPPRHSQRPARAARDSDPRGACVCTEIGRAPDELASRSSSVTWRSPR